MKSLLRITPIALLALAAAGSSFAQSTNLSDPARKDRINQAYDSYHGKQGHRNHNMVSNTSTAKPSGGLLKPEADDSRVTAGAKRAGTVVKDGAEKTGRVVKGGAEKAGGAVSNAAAKADKAIRSKVGNGPNTANPNPTPGS